MGAELNGTTNHFLRARLMLSASMAIFGTLSVFVRNIPLASGELALYRAVLAALLNRRSLPQSLAIAARFVLQAIRNTVANGTDRRYGVDFEHAIPGFIREVLPNT